jgi:hypothetical protein
VNKPSIKGCRGPNCRSSGETARRHHRVGKDRKTVLTAALQIPETRHASTESTTLLHRSTWHPPPVKASVKLCMRRREPPSRGAPPESSVQATRNSDNVLGAGGLRGGVPGSLMIRSTSSRSSIDLVIGPKDASSNNASHPVGAGKRLALATYLWPRSDRRLL